jgi:hypothetical protein
MLVVPLLGANAAPSRVERSSTAPPATLPALAKPGAIRKVGVDRAYGKLPLIFEANKGQTDGRVKFVSRSRGYTLFLTDSEAVFVLTKREALANRDRTRLSRPGPMRPEKITRTVVRMKLAGANLRPQVDGREELQGTANYFIGNGPSKWRTNVPTYARVGYRNVYPGVDLVYYGNQRQLEYDFIVAPGADPQAIRLAFEGVDRLTLDARGNLVLHTSGGEVLQRAPIVYQEIDGARQAISGRYVFRGKDRVGFQVAAYDRTRPLVIDPVLLYSTYLGGSDLGGSSHDEGRGIAVDGSGSAYVTGLTLSSDFPTASPLQAACL